MKNIAVLIDFTEGSKIALQQASGLANKIGAKVWGVHIVSSQHKVDDAEKELSAFMEKHPESATLHEAIVHVGTLTTGTQECLKKIEPDLVVVCTHGVKGMFQHLFGAQILKLVQALSFPCLVIHENCTVALADTQKMLFPIGPHPEFMVKVKEAAVLAKALNALLVIYEIDRPGGDYENLLAQNQEQAKVYFDANGVNYTKVLEEPKVFSVGYSRQTIEYASNNGISIICLMATVSKNEILFGVGDKENFLVNERGISIMTCNV
jgi:hypothetical protein